ncbi:MAG TPA: lamin tail domain-containing protein, partial [Candidatus Cloacimonadota bacterium]|nr:lamin tail domain-containing protein [Candidatus Cloacimonadota bacterium]
MKRLWIRIGISGLMMVLLSSLASRVVINELCYDPAGADSGKEWIELYNSGSQSVDLSGAYLLAGGTTYAIIFTFPYFVLRPGRFVLIGGQEVPNTHFSASFTLQNGLGDTDGIRYQSADGLYSDTVLYSSPNVNNLIDDSGLPGTSFAPVATNGKALARITDGYDTDLCADDFIVEANPTPGLPNRVYADYALSGTTCDPDGDAFLLFVYVKNLSVFTPSAVAELNICQAGENLFNAQIPPIAAGDSLYVEAYLQLSWQPVEININLPDDPVSANNTVLISPETGTAGAVVLNEILPVPASGKQEWIEIFQGARARNPSNYVICDRANNRISFALPPVSGYYLLCTNAAVLRQDYPECPESSIIQVSSWAALNNDGDELYLYDESETEVLDAMNYSAAQVASGKSLERYTNSSGTVLWRLSTSALGGTPGQPNSTAGSDLGEQSDRVKIIGSPLDPRSGDNIVVSYSLPDAANR